MRSFRVVLSLLVLVGSPSLGSRAGATPTWRPALEGPASADSPGEGDLRVNVTARAEHGDFGSGFAGLVALAIPLERFAAPRKVGVVAGDAPDEGDAGAEERIARPETAPTERGPEPALPASLLARLARDAIVAALRVQGVAVRRSELEGLGGRARWSAALPELRLRVLRSNDESLRLTPTLEEPERYTHDGGTDFLLEASATWKLGRLVFADEEIAVERLELEREKKAERLSATVLDRLFAWHRALSELADPRATPHERGLSDLARLEAEVELDVLTDGWFAGAARRVAPAARAEPASSAPSRSPSTSASPDPAK